MRDFGYIKVASAIPCTKVADCKYNSEEIVRMMIDADSVGVNVVCFPELTITGYTCGDLFAQSLLLESGRAALAWILKETAALDVIAIVGLPVATNGRLLNAAVVIKSGEILGVVPKTYLPNYKEFYEKRWFATLPADGQYTTELCGREVPLSARLLFDCGDYTFAVEICEDMWSTIPPSSVMTLNGADVVFNLSADDDCVGKYTYLKSLVSQQSARCLCGYVFSSCGFGESTTDVVFPGIGLISECGDMLAEAERYRLGGQLLVSEIDIEKIRNDRRLNTTFAECARLNAVGVKMVNVEQKSREFELTRCVNSHPFVPKGKDLDDRCREIFDIQSFGLMKRYAHTNAKTAVIGISGGLDSTLALLVTVDAFDKLGKPHTDIVGVTMPGFGTTDRTYQNAITLMRCLGVTIREISIRKACIQHFSDIGHYIDNHDVTYENSQARERTQILMDIANQTGGMVIGTGDLSELALGWATYNGDHMSMYGVNTSVPKTLVKHLVTWVAKRGGDDAASRTLLDIVDTPISPELIPADENGQIKQKTEDLVGPYELHDFFLYNVLRNGFAPRKIYALAKTAFADAYADDVIKHWLTTFFRRFFNQQFKRSCLPDGPKVGLSLSPRGDWRMPSDATSRIWLDECNNL